jgi:phosphoadenosine phosphosulfate reductase
MLFGKMARRVAPHKNRRNGRRTVRMAMTQRMLAALNREDLSPVLRERLAVARDTIPGRIVFTTSFGLEDQVITVAIAEAGLDIEIATLDTGRLFPQTYAVWSETERLINRRIRAFYPNQSELEALVGRQGIDGMFESVANRLACCGVRKVEPLARALSEAKAWVTGLRADQSASRAGVPFATADMVYQLIKINPLFDQSRDAVRAFAEAQSIPINPLHAQGFASIGCAPCTRAIASGEAERAGRWWWEQETKKECGLHLNAEGRLQRGRLLESGQ